MAIYDNTNGFVSAMQLLDFTGEYISGAYAGLDTSANIPYSMYTVDAFGDQIPIEMKSDKLAAIREKSHSQLGEAWSRLASM